MRNVYFCGMKLSPIVYDHGFENLEAYLSLQDFDNIFILTDSQTHQLCLPILLNRVKELSNATNIEVPNGEENKSIEVTSYIWKMLAKHGATRKSLLINLGGGLVTDMGGFAASTFKRGFPFIHIPTTLLSMVDASIGGKTGIDFDGLKNQIGTFSMPRLTIINTEFLKTLPDRELISGFAEMLKHGLIYDREHWNQIKDLQLPNVVIPENMIRTSSQIKSEIVETDPYETGVRKILNFGHTIGHAVESYYLSTPNPYLHGEAISIGILIESILSFDNQLIKEDELNEIFTIIVSIFGTNLIPENSIESLIQLMKQDKKNENSMINFTLLSQIGKAKFDCFLNDQQIVEGILRYNEKISVI